MLLSTTVPRIEVHLTVPLLGTFPLQPWVVVVRECSPGSRGLRVRKVVVPTHGGFRFQISVHCRGLKLIRARSLFVFLVIFRETHIRTS